MQKKYSKKIINELSEIVFSVNYFEKKGLILAVRNYSDSKDYSEYLSRLFPLLKDEIEANLLELKSNDNRLIYMFNLNKQFKEVSELIFEKKIGQKAILSHRNIKSYDFDWKLNKRIESLISKYVSVQNYFIHDVLLYISDLEKLISGKIKDSINPEKLKWTGSANEFAEIFHPLIQGQKIKLKNVSDRNPIVRVLHSFFSIKSGKGPGEIETSSLQQAFKRYADSIK